jgi:signal peptidase I
MNWDLATILVILTALSGLIWLFDAILLAPRRRALANTGQTTYTTATDRHEALRMPFWVDLARSLFPIFLVVLLLRSFLVEPFRIPSGSMMPTLLVGDFILVNKFTYGLRLPVTNTKIIDLHSPQRGDVVVFRYPENPSIPYIKRVVGLPGDHLSYNDANKTLYVNGEPFNQTVIGTYQGVGAGSSMTGAEERTENLSNVHHSILVFPKQIMPGKYREMTIPANNYFVLGDNRDNSRDSRFWGTVPEENLIGKAFFIWMNWDLQNGGISWHRLGTAIQ